MHPQWIAIKGLVTRNA